MFGEKDGRTATQNLPSPAAVRKAESEIAEYRRFQTLTGGLVDVNRKICGLRPVEQAEQTPQEKKAEAVPRGGAGIRGIAGCRLQRSAQEWPFRSGSGRNGHPVAAHQLGAKTLERLLRVPADSSRR
jgi:hypothetical protein